MAVQRLPQVQQAQPFSGLNEVVGDDIAQRQMMQQERQQIAEVQAKEQELIGLIRAKNPEALREWIALNPKIGEAASGIAKSQGEEGLEFTQNILQAIWLNPEKTEQILQAAVRSGPGYGFKMVDSESDLRTIAESNLPPEDIKNMVAMSLMLTPGGMEKYQAMVENSPGAAYEREAEMEMWAAQEEMNNPTNPAPKIYRAKKKAEAEEASRKVRKEEAGIGETLAGTRHKVAETAKLELAGVPPNKIGELRAIQEDANLTPLEKRIRIAEEHPKAYEVLKEEAAETQAGDAEYDSAMQEMARSENGIAVIDQMLGGDPSFGPTDLLGPIALGRWALGKMGVMDESTGLEQATGWESILPTLPGTPAADYEALSAQLEAMNFMEGIKAMKGMGALSNAEGLRVSAALTALKSSQSDEAARKSLNILRDAFLSARGKLQQRYGFTPRSDGSRQGVPGGSYSVGEFTVTEK